MRNAVAAFIAAIVAAAPANATFHIIVIDQMFPGFAQAPDSQYVVLRMESDLQTFVHKQPLPTDDASGNQLAPFAMFCSATTGQCDLPTVSPACADGTCPTFDKGNDSRVLVATPWAQDLFCITADLVANGKLPYPDGRVCWAASCHPFCATAAPVDCLAYGNYTGSNAPFGNAAVSPPLGQALVASPDRQGQFNGANLLEDAIGFSIGTPAPQNFHGDVGALDGLAGDPAGTGQLAADEIDAEAAVLFEADHRCALPAARRGADANLDTRINAADVVATIRIVASAR
jgi:hypothetical protein